MKLLAHLRSPTAPRWVDGAGLPKLFDHTLSSDFRQYNHLLISIVRNFAIMTSHDHDTFFRHIDTATEAESGPIGYIRAITLREGAGDAAVRDGG